MSQVLLVRYLLTSRVGIRSSRSWLARVATSISIVLWFSVPSLAATKNWNLPGGGNWNVGVNWNLAGVPGTGDTVNITGFVNNFVNTIIYDYPGPAVTLNSLTLNAAITAFNSPSVVLSMAGNNLSATTEHVGEGLASGNGGVGTFTQSGGTNTVGSGGLFLGFNTTGQGFYNLSGTGTLAASTGTEFIGFSGQGTFTETTGANSAALLNLGVNAGAVGNYNLSGASTLSITGDEIVGSLGSGTFQQSAGTQTVGGSVLVGQSMGATGTYFLTGGSLSGFDEVVGNSGTATFTQSAGTNTLTNEIFVGKAAGSMGTYNLSGTGAITCVAIVVGTNGTGVFNQTGGTISSSLELDLGGGANGHGTYNLSGGTLNNTGTHFEFIGNNGTGTFNQSGGAHLAGILLVGDDNFGAGGTGTSAYTLSGGTLSCFQEMIEGGTFTQTGGSNSTTDAAGLLVGGRRNSSYSLSGDGQLHVLSGSEEITSAPGSGAMATFNQSGGSNSFQGGVAGDDLHVGKSGAGTYNLSGGNLFLISVGGALNAFVGESGGAGTFNQTGGETDMEGVLNVGIGASSVGVYNLSSGVVFAAKGDTVGGAGGGGSFIQTGGQNNIGYDFQSGQLKLAADAGSTGAYNLSGGFLLIRTGEEIIGDKGSAVFIQSAGTNQIGDVPGIAGNLRLGASAGSSGSYTLSGVGVLHVSGDETVAEAGVGSFMQSGGVHSIGGSLTIAELAGADGSFTLSGGLLTVNGGVNVGIGVGLTGTAVLTVGSAGVLTVSDSNKSIVVFNAPGNSLNFNGGTINTPDMWLLGNSSHFHWTTGTLNFTKSVSSDHLVMNSVFVNNTVLATGQTLSVMGDETLGGLFSFNLTLNSGSTHYVQGALNLNPAGVLTQNAGSTFYAGTFQMAGGIVNGTLTNQGDFHYQSGLFNGRLVNQGTVTLEVPSITLGNGLENDADIALDAAHTIVANGAGFTNLGTFTLAGGTLSGSPIVNDFSGVMTAHGTINPAFSNNGHLTVDGALRFNALATNAGILGGSGVVIGAFSNSASGTVELAAGNALSFNTSWTNAGLVSLGGATASLAGSTITNQGTIEGVGTVTAPVVNSTGVIRAAGGELRMAGNGSSNGSGGQIQAPAGATVIYLNGLGNNSGVISLTGGTFDNNAHQLNNLGTINGTGTLRTGGVGLNIALGGLLAVGGGDMNVLGPVTNNGTVNIQGGRTAYFFGNVNGSGVYTGAGTADFLGSLSPGNSPASVSFAGNVILGGAASLIIELGGTTPGTQYDQLHVMGNLALGGTLQVSLGGFTPATGNSFDILDWGSLTGQFSALALPTVAGLAWDTSQLYTTGVISLASTGIPGDYNQNGVVDAADYVVWRKNSGTTNTLANDPIGGTIGSAQFNQWRAHFGQTAGSGSGASANAAVPEPATLVLLIFAAAGWCLRRGCTV